MVKGFSRGKFATVDFYFGKLYQGDLRLHVNLCTTVTLISVFTQSFFRNDLKDYQSERDLRAQKAAVYIQMDKNITQMVQVEFLKFENQGNKCGVNPNANLPCKKSTNLCSNYLVCKQIISNVSLNTSLK